MPQAGCRRLRHPELRGRATVAPSTWGSAVEHLGPWGLKPAQHGGGWWGEGSPSRAASMELFPSLTQPLHEEGVCARGGRTHLVHPG